MMTTAVTTGTRRLHALALVTALSVLGPQAALNAQGLESEKTIDTIVGSDVKTEEARAANDPAAIIAAIEDSLPNTEEVRKRSKLANVEIVFLEDLAEAGEPESVEKKVKEHKEEIVALREAIEGNAMFFHAIDSRSVLTSDVVAVEFERTDGVKIYAAAKPAER
jgi:hypothetical protein